MPMGDQSDFAARLAVIEHGTASLKELLREELFEVRRMVASNELRIRDIEKIVVRFKVELVLMSLVGASVGGAIAAAFMRYVLGG